MADKMLRVAGRGEDGTAKALSTDNNGNLNSSLSKRNELITWGSHAIAGDNGMKSVILRYDELEDYSALVFSMNSDASSEFNVIANWYMKENDGKQVARQELVNGLNDNKYASEYLEIRGSELTIIMVNKGASTVNVDAYLMGIR